jgi:hypothetical protein
MKKILLYAIQILSFVKRFIEVWKLTIQEENKHSRKIKETKKQNKKAVRK